MLPQTVRNQRRLPQVSIYPSGQAHFSNAFNPLLGKNKLIPLGTHPHLTFRWGLDGERAQVNGYEEEMQEMTFGPTGVLFVQFSDIQTDFSIEMKSKYPRNVIGLQSILQSVKDRFGNQGFPMRQVDKYRPSEFIISHYDESRDSTEHEAWDFIPWRPRAGERYLFCRSTLEIDAANRACALLWSNSIVTETERKAPTEGSEGSESITADDDSLSEPEDGGEGEPTAD